MKVAEHDLLPAVAAHPDAARCWLTASPAVPSSLSLPTAQRDHASPNSSLSTDLSEPEHRIWCSDSDVSSCQVGDQRVRRRWITRCGRAASAPSREILLAS